MASLTEASILSRKIIRFAIYAVIVLIIGRIALYFGSNVYKRFFPPEPPKATTAFGKLPQLPFPESKSTIENVVYSLETAQGELPVFPELALVYEMPQAQANLQALDSAKLKAQSLGFSQDGKLILENVPNIYRFEKLGRPSSLTMNIITGVFSVSYDIPSDPEVLSQVPPAPTQAVSYAHGFLSRAGLDQTDLTGPETTEFYKAEGRNFIKTSSLSEAQITKVNLFRKNYGEKEELPAVTQNMPEANVWLMFTGRGTDVLASEYHYFPIDNKKFGTYPIKTAQEAWKELEEGKAYVANQGQQTTNQVVIRKVYLGYYDAGQYTPYYQPVVVFEGDGGYYSYVPAITNEFYGTTQE